MRLRLQRRLLFNLRPASNFNAGFIRAPIPTVALSATSGSSHVGNGGVLTVKRGLLGLQPVSVNFSLGAWSSNFNLGSTSVRWTISGTTASTASAFTNSFSKPGAFLVQAIVTNGLGISTIASATIVVQ